MIVRNDIHGAIQPEEIAAMCNAVSIGDTVSVKTKTGEDRKGKVVYKTPYFAMVKIKGNIYDSILWIDLVIKDRERIKNEMQNVR